MRDPPAAPPAGRRVPSARYGATDAVRWAAFSCFLIPVALLWYGASLAGTAGTAVGLAAVTGACRLLLRRAERRTLATEAREQRIRENRPDD
nr:hypothetical protein [Streptomyces sp. SID8352]